MPHFQVDSFLLFFSKLTIRSRLINWVAISAFSVYLTHSNAYLAKYYDGTILKWFNECSTFSFIIHTCIFIIGVYLISILLDKVRMKTWKCILSIKNYKEHFRNIWKI